METNNCEKRASDRKIIEKYYSVQFSVKELISAYRFKLFDIVCKRAMYSNKGRFRSAEVFKNR